MDIESTREENAGMPDFSCFRRFPDPPKKTLLTKERTPTPQVAWSSQNVVAFGGLSRGNYSQTNQTQSELQILAYESILSSKKQKLAEKIETSCLPLSILTEDGSEHSMKYKLAGLKWNDLGNSLAVWDEMGTLQILRSECTNSYQQIYYHEFHEPIVGLAWLPTGRTFKFDPDTGISRRPLLGPVNPFGELALVGLTCSGRVLLVYQVRGCTFHTAEKNLPFQMSSISQAGILMGTTGRLFLVLKPVLHSKLNIISATISFEETEMFCFNHVKTLVSKIALQGFSSQVEDGLLVVLMFGSCMVGGAQEPASLLSVTEISSDAAPRKREEIVKGTIEMVRLLPFRRRILVSLKSGELQVREFGGLTVTHTNSVSSLLSGPHSLFHCAPVPGTLASLEFSANNCLALILTAGRTSFGIVDVVSWLESTSQEMAAEAFSNAILSCILIGINQGFDLVDVASCLSSKPLLQPDSVISKVVALSCKTGQVPQHLGVRITAFQYLLYRYSKEDRNRRLCKLALLSRLQHARDLLYSSLAGDSKNPFYPNTVFSRIVPSGIWLMHMLLFLFRDMYLYYNTKCLNVDGSVVNHGNPVRHLAILAYFPFRKLISEVINWISILNNRISQSLPDLNQPGADSQALEAAKCWTAEWEQFPVSPILLINFYQALIHHFNEAWKSTSLPPETTIPSSIPKWALDLLEHMRNSLLDQFTSAWEPILGVDTNWLSIGLASPLPLSRLVLRLPTVPQELSWLPDQFPPLVTPVPQHTPQADLQPRRSNTTIKPSTPSITSLTCASPKTSRSKSISSHFPLISNKRILDSDWNSSSVQETKRTKTPNQRSLFKVCLRCCHYGVPLSQQWEVTQSAKELDVALTQIPNSHVIVGVSTANCPCGGPWASSLINP